MTSAFDLDFGLDRAVPWGRNRAEYLAFFDLLDLASGARILDCGAGPSSFNAEMTALGFEVVSADPLYGCGKPAIAGRIAGARRATCNISRRRLISFLKSYTWAGERGS